MKMKSEALKRLLGSKWNFFFGGAILFKIAPLTITTLVVIWIVIIVLKYAAEEGKIMLEEEKKRIEQKKTTLPFSETLKPGDEIYPGVKIERIEHTHYKPEVTLHFSRDIWASPFTQSHRYEVDQSFSFKNSPWLVKIERIDVQRQEIEIYCST